MSFIQLWREVAQLGRRSTSTGTLRPVRCSTSSNAVNSWSMASGLGIGSRLGLPMAHSTHLGGFQTLRIRSTPFASYATSTSRVTKRVKSSTTSGTLSDPTTEPCNHGVLEMRVDGSELKSPVSCPRWSFCSTSPLELYH